MTHEGPQTSPDDSHRPCRAFHPVAATAPDRPLHILYLGPVPTGNASPGGGGSRTNYVYLPGQTLATEAIYFDPLPDASQLTESYLHHFDAVARRFRMQPWDRRFKSDGRLSSGWEPRHPPPEGPSQLGHSSETSCWPPSFKGQDRVGGVERRAPDPSAPVRRGPQLRAPSGTVKYQTPSPGGQPAVRPSASGFRPAALRGGTRRGEAHFRRLG